MACLGRPELNIDGLGRLIFTHIFLVSFVLVLNEMELVLVLEKARTCRVPSFGLSTSTSTKYEYEHENTGIPVIMTRNVGKDGLRRPFFVAKKSRSLATLAVDRGL